MFHVEHSTDVAAARTAPQLAETWTRSTSTKSDEPLTGFELRSSTWRDVVKSEKEELPARRQQPRDDSSRSAAVDPDGPHRHQIVQPCRIRRRSDNSSNALGQDIDVRSSARSRDGFAQERRLPLPSTRPSSTRQRGRTIFSGMAGEPPPEPRSNHGRAGSPTQPRCRQRLDRAADRGLRSGESSNGSAVRLICRDSSERAGGNSVSS